MKTQPDFSWVFESDPSWVPTFMEPALGFVCAVILLYAIVSPWLGARRG